MGAEPYEYIVPYEKNIQTALNKLRQHIFETGQYNGADLNPPTPEMALEMIGADGTRSILDIFTISETPELCCAAPFSEDELRQYFGTDKPTKEILDESDEFWGELERGMAYYFILYDEQGEPKYIYFAGYSFD